MRLIAILGLMLSVCAVSPAHSQETKAKKKQTPATAENVHKRLNGEWRIAGGANQGKESKPENIRDTLVVVRDHTIVVLDPDENELYKAMFEVDVTQKPIHIDMVTKMPNNAETKALGIIKFTKKGWTLCYDLTGKERPEKFESAAGSQVMLFEMQKREEKKEPLEGP